MSNIHQAYSTAAIFLRYKNKVRFSCSVTGCDFVLTSFEASCSCVCERGREKEHAKSHAHTRLFEMSAAPDHDCKADLKYALMAERLTVTGDIEELLLLIRLPDPLLKMAYFLLKAASLVMAFSCRHTESFSIHACFADKCSSECLFTSLMESRQLRLMTHQRACRKKHMHACLRPG